jgi:ribose-phosphate pyrophosphokinase
MSTQSTQGGLTATPTKRMLLTAGRSHPELAAEVASELGVEMSPISAYDFANGEIFVRFEESVRGSDAFVLQSHTLADQQWIMEQLIMVDASSGRPPSGSPSITPFYGYARQDKKHRGREPITARLMATCSDRRRRPGDDCGPAHLADPGLLRRAGGPPVRLPLLAEHVGKNVRPRNG